jgi:hypothetical protein
LAQQSKSPQSNGNTHGGLQLLALLYEQLGPSDYALSAYLEVVRCKMAVPTHSGGGGTASAEEDDAFLEQSFLTYTVPFRTDLNIEEEVRAAIAKGQPLEDMENRPWLFFGEDLSQPTFP